MTDITPDSLQIARLEERMQVLARDVEAQTARLAEMQEQLAQVLSALSAARGGWRTLMMIGGAVATAATGWLWALDHIKLK